MAPANFLDKRFRAIWQEINGRVYDGALGDFPGVEVSSGLRRIASTIIGRDAEGEPTVEGFTISEHVQGDGIDDAIRHEIAHAAAVILDGDKGHGPTWKRHARRCGAEPTRCAGNVNQIERQAIYDKINYVLVCEDCGPIGVRQQRSKIVKKIHHYACGDCAGSMTVIEDPSPDQIEQVLDAKTDDDGNFKG